MIPDGEPGRRAATASEGHKALVAGLARLGWRVRLRWLVERLRIALIVALSSGAITVLLGRTLGYADWAGVASLFAAISLLASLTLGLRSWPDLQAIARAADSLGLAERVSSALHAEGIAHPAARLLTADATARLARTRPERYPIIPATRRWLPVIPLAFMLAVAVLAPLPGWIDGGGAEQARAVAEARKSVQELKASLQKTAEPEPISAAAEEELKALDERLQEARTAEEAGRMLERSQEKLASLMGPEDYAWKRALERLSSAWAGDAQMSNLSAAMRSQDPAAIEDALERLAAQREGMSAEELQQLQLALQAGANAARDLPALSGALRAAASEAAGGDAGDGSQTGATGELASLLSGGATTAAGLQSVHGAMAGLGQAQAGLAAAGGSGAAALASGRPVGSASGGQAGDGSGSGSGSGTGSGAGDGSRTGSGSGAGTGSGAGSSSGTGSGSGETGGQGSGAGAGAGAGGGPSPGRPGSGNQGATMVGGNASPSQSGATRYDPIYAPSLLGGEGGPRVDAPGDAAGTGGATVELSESPLTLGAVRPYNEVYGQYEASARQSLSRQPLPPSLQSLVQRYFSSIAPPGGSQ